MKVDGQITLGTIWNMFYPLLLAILFLILSLVFNFSYKVTGFEDVLESIINFSSIIIGFYTAMYGIMFGILHSDIFKILKKNESNKYLKYQLYDSLITSFLVLIISICMQMLRHITFVIGSFDIILIITNIWVLLVGYLVGTSFRSISLLLKLMFNNEKVDKNDGIVTEESAKKSIEQLPKK